MGEREGKGKGEEETKRGWKEGDFLTSPLTPFSFTQSTFSLPSWSRCFMSLVIYTSMFFFSMWGLLLGSFERILKSYANPRLRLGFAQLSRILPTPTSFPGPFSWLGKGPGNEVFPTPLVFRWNYENTGKVHHCLNNNDLMLFYFLPVGSVASFMIYFS